MFHYLFLFVISFLISLIIIPLLRQTAIEGNVLDQPDERKIHRMPLPRLGGIAIAIAFFFSIGTGYTFFAKEQYYSESIIGICIGASIIALVGLWDDIRGLTALKKFLGQIAAILATIPFGFIIKELNVPFVGIIEVNSIVGLLLVIFWIVGIMNTINLIDGIDGLAAGVIIKIAGALFIISLLTNQIQMAVICVVLIGAVAGFLRYNFPPATIFMGDCGALLLGFITSVVAIKVLFQNPNLNSSSVAPVLIFGLPILDTTWAIIRRLLNRQAFFNADLGHLHHRLLAISKKQTKATLMLYLLNLISISSGIVVIFSNNSFVTLFICVFMLIIGILVILALRQIPTQNEAICIKNLKEKNIA
ncbi:TPA: undecaprenyl/decaprenyl-phosphate alpha-N-acetylglucosaminyl 1-phosphate transferase [bacterium]|nr:undecaprenyl/decaprenyl-phosphate alpha-N-acetylglucosaminyl 1-phosphate transferase [bacterium]